MPFHVELRRAMHRAWLFNLDEPALRARVLGPWAVGTAIDVDGRRFEPRESTVRVLEGPHLDTADLAFGQGGNAAERTARDVTAALFARPRGATVVSPTREGFELGAKLLVEAGLAPLDWGEVRAGLIGRDPAARPAAALVMAVAEPGPWLFDAGLVIGALGDRALVLAAEPGAPAHLGGVEVLDAEEALRRLRAAR